MRKIILLTLFTISIFSTNAQHVYDVKDFSDRYTAKVYCENIGEDYEGYDYPFEVKIYDRLTGKEVISVVRYSNLENEFENLEEGEKIKANINDFPYGEQSIIIAGDFNCDGEEDLAIQTSNYWMHLPSYVIYSYKDGELVEDEEWTNLIAGEGCGIFKHNCETKTLETYCYRRHESETESRYSIENGSPFLIEQIQTIHASPSFPYAT